MVRVLSLSSRLDIDRTFVLRHPDSGVPMQVGPFETRSRVASGCTLENPSVYWPGRASLDLGLRSRPPSPHLRSTLQLLGSVRLNTLHRSLLSAHLHTGNGALKLVAIVISLTVLRPYSVQTRPTNSLSYLMFF